MQEKELLAHFEACLPHLLSLDEIELKFEQYNPLDHFDVIIEASYHDLHFSIVAELVAQISLSELKKRIIRIKESAISWNGAVPVVVAPYLSPERQQLCRKEGVGFIDLSGNVYLKFKSLFIERVGFPNKYPVKRQGRSPFSDKASLVLRALLSGGNRLWGIRELAQEIALDPGYVSRMAREIENRGYVKRIDSKLSLRSPEGILEDWVKSYNLKKNQLSVYFCMAESVDDILHRLRSLDLPGDVHYALSVQAGANFVAPYSNFKEVHVYAQEAKDVEVLEKQMNLKPVAQGGNLVIMRPYYRNSVFYNSRRVDGLRIVSDIQLYLDLHGYPLRGLEQAEHLLEKRIRPFWEEVDDDE
jgi:hypothetical protein